MSEVLFDLAPGQICLPEPAGDLSPGRRRTLRQAEALRLGRHPIGLAKGFTLRLHETAPPAGDRSAPGPRCGTCRFRALIHHHDGRYPKCLRGWPEGASLERAPYASHSAATDCRAWWPACEHWEPDP